MRAMAAVGLWLDRQPLLAATVCLLAGIMCGYRVVGVWWAVIAAVGPGTKCWIQGPVTYGSPMKGPAVRPLTVTFEAGDGQVLYTSYHTAEDKSGTAPTELLPQEQVLAYLAFELF